MSPLSGAQFEVLQQEFAQRWACAQKDHIHQPAQPLISREFTPRILRYAIELNAHPVLTAPLVDALHKNPTKFATVKNDKLRYTIYIHLNSTTLREIPVRLLIREGKGNYVRDDSSVQESLPYSNFNEFLISLDLNPSEYIRLTPQQ